jgi:hypothetical protein
MDPLDPRNAIRMLKKMIIDIDPKDVIKDACSAGLQVETIEDFRTQAKNYWRIEDVMEQYSGVASRYSAISGATAGSGGLATAITLGGVDIANMAAQLYRLNQRLAILNGFDIANKLHQEKTVEIYLYALGFDAAVQAAIRQQLTRAATIAGKRGAYSNYVLRLIVLTAGQLGAKITSKQAAKFIPIVGGVAGAGINYAFAGNAARKMRVTFKDEYFRTWQAGQ